MKKGVLLQSEINKLSAMCRYNIAIDDALLEEIKPHISKDIELQAWLEEMLHKALLSYVAQFSSELKGHGEEVCSQLEALGDTPEGFFGLHSVLKPSSVAPEELKDEYIAEKYGV